MAGCKPSRPSEAFAARQTHNRTCGRVHKRHLSVGSFGLVPRSALVLAIALPLAAADLLWKHVATTPAWAYHPRGLAWLALSVALVGVAFAAARLSSRLAVLAAGVMTGGLLGNVLSAAWNDLRVPDPIIVVHASTGVIAFNLADAFTSTGILALTAALAMALVRHRHVLPTRQEAGAMVQRAARRRR